MFNVCPPGGSGDQEKTKTRNAECFLYLKCKCNQNLFRQIHHEDSPLTWRQGRDSSSVNH